VVCVRDQMDWGPSIRESGAPGQRAGGHRQTIGRVTNGPGRARNPLAATGSSGCIHPDHCSARADVWPASPDHWARDPMVRVADVNLWRDDPDDRVADPIAAQDRKSTRLNSSHVKISYAVFCLKKKR